MDFWQTTRRPSWARAAVDTVLLALAGAMLFMMSTQLLEPFSKLTAVLAKTSLLEWKNWLRALVLTFPVGLFWIFFFVVFEGVRDDLLRSLFPGGAKRIAEPAATPCASRRPTFQQRRRALLAYRRQTGRARRIALGTIER